ncbi:hypothetical protein D3C79_995400 [compost metagenome]
MLLLLRHLGDLLLQRLLLAAAAVTIVMQRPQFLRRFAARQLLQLRFGRRQLLLHDGQLALVFLLPVLRLLPLLQPVQRLLLLPGLPAEGGFLRAQLS